jgi:branched-chain amino acid transport system substrate-binding protein
MRPISTSCADHRGANWGRVHTWDGSKWAFSSDWYQSDDSIIKPLTKASADKYLAEKKMQRRPNSDCQS